MKIDRKIWTPIFISRVKVGSFFLLYGEKDFPVKGHCFLDKRQKILFAAKLASTRCTEPYRKPQTKKASAVVLRFYWLLRARWLFLCVTFPAITVATVILKALDRVCDRALASPG